MGVLTDKLIDLGYKIDPYDFEPEMICDISPNDLPIIAKETEDLRTEYADYPIIVSLINDIQALCRKYSK